MLIGAIVRRYCVDGEQASAELPICGACVYSRTMPLGAPDHLDELYSRQRVLSDEAERLETERDKLDPYGTDGNRHYILELQIAALLQEANKINSRISDILDRDLQR